VLASFNAEGSRILTIGSDDAPRLWDASTGREIATLHSAEAHIDADFRFVGAHVMGVYPNGTIRRWGADDGRQTDVRTHDAFALERDGAEGVRNSIVGISADGSLFVTASWDAATLVWDARSGRQAAALAHGHDVYHAAFSPDGSRVATASIDSARIWDAASGRELVVLGEHGNGAHTVAFSADGKRAATSSPDGARVFDAMSGHELASFEVGDSINSVAFSPDGRYLLAASADKTARVWDVSRTAALCGDVAEVLAASLTSGRGLRSESERADLLMQSAPDDLYEALMARLTPEQRENVARRAEILARPLHPNCYIPPSQRPGYAAR
jgi:WD40 repeat protein